MTIVTNYLYNIEIRNIFAGLPKYSNNRNIFTHFRSWQTNIALSFSILQERERGKRSRK